MLKKQLILHLQTETKGDKKVFQGSKNGFSANFDYKQSVTDRGQIQAPNR